MDFWYFQPLCDVWAFPQVFFSEKMTSLDFFDMYFTIFDINSQYLIEFRADCCLSQDVRELINYPFSPPLTPFKLKNRDWAILIHGNCRYSHYANLVFRSKIEKCKHFFSASGFGANIKAPTPPFKSKNRDWAILIHGNCRYGYYTNLVPRSNIDIYFSAAGVQTAA